MLRGIMRGRRLIGLLMCGVALAGITAVTALTGCDTCGPPRDEVTVDSAADECLFAGEPNPEKAESVAVAGEVATEKAGLTLDGSWRTDSVAVGTWERHRISCTEGYTYIVELDTQTAGSLDDPDLYLSRDEDPFAHPWKASLNLDPLPDTIVFRAKQSGRMYVAVRGWNSQDDANVDYVIRVRKRLNPASG